MSDAMQKIVIQMESGPREVDALIFGGWAAHRSLGGEPGWSVTYVEHGRRAASELDKRGAVKIATMLNERVPNFRWSGKDDEMPHADDLAAAKAVLREVRGW